MTPTSAAAIPQSSEFLPTNEELLTTTRSVRRRLDYERPVSRAVVEDCLRIAFQAPTGLNQQDWGWIVVDDPATRATMGELYRESFRQHWNRDRSQEGIADRSTAGAARIGRSVSYLADRIQDVPMLLIPTIGRQYGDSTPFAVASRWGSILPAVWNFMLALRMRGMGSAWTTMHLYREREMAELLGIPDDQMQVGMFPIAYTVGTDFAAADRSDSERRIYWNRWEQR